MSSQGARRAWREPLGRTLLVVAMALAVLAIGWHYLSAVVTARDLASEGQALAGQVRSLDPGEFDAATVADLRGGMNRLDQRVLRLRAFLAGDPLVGLARGNGLLDDQVLAADVVLAAADDLVEAGQVAIGLGERLVAVRERSAGDSGGSLFVGLVDLMGSTRGEVETIEARLAAADARIGQLPAGAWSGFRRAFDSMSGPVREYRPLLGEYRRMAAVLPEALGWREVKRYLVLAQNPAELRPTGGYTGTVGIVTFRPDGPPEQRFIDVYTIDLIRRRPYVEPPLELQAYLLGEQSWKVADANWSPDFPTSAQDALFMYTLQTGDDDIDGVIGITTFALDRAMTVTGPVRVPEYDVTVEPGEVTMTGLSLTRGISTPTSERKSFLNHLAARVVDRVYALPQDKWMALLKALEGAADEHLMMVWFRDPQVQQIVDGAPIAGQMRNEPGDYLYVVEANVAPTSKYNLAVTRETRLEVTLDAEGNTTSALQVDWQNDAGNPGPPYTYLREYSTNQNGFYGAFVRVLTPASSTLQLAEGQALDPIGGAASIGVENGRSYFGNYLLMAPGESYLRYAWTATDVAFAHADGWRYQLTIEKQPGLHVEDVRVIVTLPEGATVTALSERVRERDGRIVWSGDVSTDQQITIDYQLP